MSQREPPHLPELREAPDPPPGAGGGVWELAWPSMAAFGFQSLTGFVNMLIVSGLGTEAVAAVGVASQVHFVLFAVLAAVTTGTVALVARATGARDADDADRVLRLSLLLAGAMGLLAMGVAPFAEEVVASFGVAARVARLGGDYLRILFAFNVPFAVGLVFASALRGAGDVRTPLVVGVLVNAVDVVLCWALVYGRLGAPALGTNGAAIALGISILLGLSIYLALWLRNDLVIRRRRFVSDLDAAGARRVLRIGAPTALEQLAFQAGLWVFLRLVAEFGTDPVSAYLIGVRILSMSFVPGLGFQTAASTLVGQNLGAGRPDLAIRSGWRATGGAVVVMGGIGLAIIALAQPLAGAFGAAGEATVELTVQFIYILGAAQALMAVEFALGGALRGAGDTRFPLFAILTGLFVFRLGLALTVSRLFDGSVVAVWSCLLADYAVKAVMLSARFASGRWQRVRV
ncbi:MAG: MATE family efflux transporter [Myxococcota bacterium]|nr:MATE family efflux transporter [Myxococcota bacterium]